MSIFNALWQFGVAAFMIFCAVWILRKGDQGDPRWRGPQNMQWISTKLVPILILLGALALIISAIVRLGS